MQGHELDELQAKGRAVGLSVAETDRLIEYVRRLRTGIDQAVLRLSEGPMSFADRHTMAAELLLAAGGHLRD